MSTAIDLIKKKWHVAKSNPLKILPQKKETYCIALQKFQPTVFIKVGSKSFQRFLKALQFNYKPFDVLRHILKGLWSHLFVYLL